MTKPDFQEEEVAERPVSARLIWRLVKYLRPYSGWVVLALVCILATTITRQATPYLTKIAVDEHILKHDLAGLYNIVLLFAALLLFQGVSNYFERYLTKLTGQWAMYDVRTDLFRHIQRLPLKFFDRMPVGRLMTRNTSDVDALNEMFSDGIVATFSDVLTVATILGYMFYMNVRLAIIMCLAIPIMFFVAFYFNQRILRAFQVARSRLARLNAFLQENISGMAVVQLFSRERRHMDKFTEINRRYLDANLKSTYYFTLNYPILEFIGVAATAAILWYGADDVILGQLDWGILIAMLQYIPRFFFPVMDISERFGTVQMATASAERIFELLDTEPEGEGGAVALDRVNGRIEFRNVWFAYQSENWVLRNVSFVIEAGQSAAIVGATGSGKSTIISLVSRFYDVQQGTILLDGIDIREWNVEALRRRVGIVQQDVFLFSGTIAENIRMGEETISDVRVRQAAHDVNADRFIDQLPDGYESLLTERGSTLSSGQRQLISFARALAFEPDILVLDEATASVDTETEVWIQEAVERLMHSRTSIIIAHRLSTIRNADRILVMHRGELRESGTHDALLQQDGLYRRLHQLQYLDSSP